MPDVRIDRQESPDAATESVLEAVLERVIYVNEATGYTVALVATERGDGDGLTVVGSLCDAQVGETLHMSGRWTFNTRYGRRFEVQSYVTVLPTTTQGIRRYLGSGLILGIGPVIAERIAVHFGADIVRVIEEEPERLAEVPGVGPKRSRLVADAWEEQKAIKEVLVFFQGLGVYTSLAVRIYQRYGDATISMVRSEPYRLAADVSGIGFKTADRIAAAVGIPHHSPERIYAGLQHTLSQAADNGHCFLPLPNLVTEAAEILGVGRELVISCLDKLTASEGVIREIVTRADREIPAVYLLPFHRAECSLASGLLDLLHAEQDRMTAFQNLDWDRELARLRRRTGDVLTAEQEQAVQLALTKRVAVLTGGPGCGKSFTISSIVELARAKNATVVLAAPTGRAAKRLSERTGHSAATVHRLLQLQPGGDAAYDRDNPLDADLVVVDEASMMDLTLANKLVKAIPRGAHLLLVGDVDQLPSVGPGEVLRDLLAASEVIPRVRLSEIFRQAQQSGIVVNAHLVNVGTDLRLRDFPDFFWFKCEDPEQTADLTADIVTRRIPLRFGLDPRRDIQVLTPVHRGPTGAANLNVLLQDMLTPHAEGEPECIYGGRAFRIGDRVTQLRNNYDKGAAGIFNGAFGVVTGISVGDRELTVLTDEDESVQYGFDELYELAHAYAVTIHRSQGSEYPAVVIPLTTSPRAMLRRNLLYTAITRATKLAVLVGSYRALADAVRTQGAGRRHTGLTSRLELGA